MARHLREAKGEGEADDEAFAAGEVFGRAHGASLVVVEHLQFQGLPWVVHQEVAVAEFAQLAIGVGDHDFKVQALREVAEFFAITRANERVEFVPAFLNLPLLLHALLLRLGLALRLGVGAQLLLKLSAACVASLLLRARLGKLPLQAGGVELAGYALLGERPTALLLLGAFAVELQALVLQAALLLLQLRALGAGQQRGDEGGFVGEARLL